MSKKALIITLSMLILVTSTNCTSAKGAQQAVNKTVNTEELPKQTTIAVATTAQDAGITVQVNGQAVVFTDAKPFIDSSNRTLVPVRFIVEKLGAQVNWDGAVQTVSIKKDSTSISLKIGQSQATVNGTVKTFDTAARIVSDRTFVPLRFISETLSASVEWQAATKTVVITTGGGTGTQNINGFVTKIPGNGSSLIEISGDDVDRMGKDSPVLYLQVNLEYGNVNEQHEEVREILLQRFEKGIVDSVMQYVSQKLQNQNRIPFKKFTSNTGFHISVSSMALSPAITVGVYKD